MASSVSKLVLVTGASSGIGQAIAENLAQSGYSVIGTYLKSEKQARDISDKFPQTKFYQVDLTNRSDRRKFISSLKGLTFYGLVNNAGVYEADDINRAGLDIWDRQIELHLTAPIDLIRGLISQIQSGGIIINIASILGSNIASYESVGYAASKSALSEITKTLTVMLQKKHIRVNAVSPGLITSPPSLQSSNNWLDKVAHQTPIGRNGTPHDIANIVKFLLSSDYEIINGQVIVADGGFSIINDF